MDESIYDRDYFERGIETGKSCYQNYRWIPELTIPLAMSIIDYLEIPRGATILDYGCAKGFLTKAFRLLYRDAIGVDISKYAISQVDVDVQEYCFLKEGSTTLKYRLFEPDPLRFIKSVGGRDHFSYCVAKDVFEHIPKVELSNELQFINATRMFAIIPLGDDKGFNAKPNNMDCTHVLCKDIEWWEIQFRESGWKLLRFTFRVEGIKDSYYERYPKGFGFFTLENNK